MNEIKNGSETPKSSMAKNLRRFSKTIIGIISIGCGVGGACFGYEVCPFNMTSYVGSSRNGNDLLNGIVWLGIGLVAGAILSYLLTMLLLYFAELGENTKITAQSTKASAQKSENEEINNADALKKYKELLENGTITQEEFDAKKKQLLNI